MEALALEARGFPGTYKLVGGRPSLDFVNTVSWPGTDREHDWLDPAGNLIHWAVALEILAPAAARALERDTASNPAMSARSLARVRDLRACIRRVLEPLSRGERPATPDVEALNELLIPCQRSRYIDPVRLEWVWEPPVRLDEVTRPVIADAADLLVDSDHTRIRSCRACSWLFYDSTRNRSRRWCDMADCGSRAKARRYYRRKIARSNDR